MQLSQPGPVRRDRLALIELPDPAPGAGDVAIHVSANAMCRTDLQIVSGDLESHRLPLIPGHQAVGTITAAGAGVDQQRIGTRVGLVWLAGACGECRFCLSGRENLCPEAQFTGWDCDGGYATNVIARSDYAFDLSALSSRAPESIAPLLCAGVIGYRSLRVAGVDPGSGAAGLRLGLYGYGASARQVLKIARHWNVETHVITRSRSEAENALAAGATWAGLYDEEVPVRLDAAITFAPVGSVVIRALQALERGGIVAINAIHLDGIPAFDYDQLWLERSLRSVANVTGADVREFIALVAEADIQTEYELLPLSEANEGLRRIEASDVRGSFVLI